MTVYYCLTESHKSCTRVQDPYTMRCVPQVHGVVHDTIKFVRDVLTTEMNSALDNPVSLSLSLSLSLSHSPPKLFDVVYMYVYTYQVSMK